MFEQRLTDWGAVEARAQKDASERMRELQHTIELEWSELRQDREAKLDPVEREVSSLYDTLAVMAGIFSGEALRIVPHPTDKNGAWFSLADLDDVAQPPIQRIKTLTAALIAAYQSDDRASLGAAASALSRRLAELAPATYPPAKELGVEVQYNRVKPFRLAWIAYLFGFLLLLASFPLGARWAGRTGLGLVLLGFALHAYGMGLRVYISGRPPVSRTMRSATSRTRYSRPDPTLIRAPLTPSATAARTHASTTSSTNT